MDIGSKIWYTWGLCTIVVGLIAWNIDWDKHPRLGNILAVLIVAPIATGLIVGFIYMIVWIWK